MRTLSSQQDRDQDRDERAPTDLEVLLDDVAAATLDDPAWSVLRRRARMVTRALANRGELSAGAVVDVGDPPVAVARALAVAARQAADLAGRGYADRRGPVAC